MSLLVGGGLCCNTILPTQTSSFLSRVRFLAGVGRNFNKSDSPSGGRGRVSCKAFVGNEHTTKSGIHRTQTVRVLKNRWSLGGALPWVEKTKKIFVLRTRNRVQAQNIFTGKKVRLS